MATTNKPDRSSTGQNTGSSNPQNTTTSTSDTGERKPPTGQQGDYHFRCADVGFNECKWETRGNSPDEVLRNAEQHGRQQHNLTNIDDETRNRVRSQIHKAA